MKSVTILLAVMGVVFGLSGSAGAYTFKRLDVPGAALTRAHGINNLGDVVGTYRDTNLGWHGYVYDGDTYTSLDYPGYNTFANRINDSGVIAGNYRVDDYYPPDFFFHGFIYDGSSYSSLDVPDAVETRVEGLNNLGVIVGNYWAKDDNDDIITYGFVYDGSYTTLGIPGANGINDWGVIVGTHAIPDDVNGGFDIYGFVYDGSTYTLLDYPGAKSTYAYDINSSGVIVGWYSTSSSVRRGFVFDGSTYYSLKYPWSTGTYAYGINDAGDIVGIQHNSSGVFHGFIASWEEGDPVGTEPPDLITSAANYDESGNDGDPVNTFTGELFNQFSPDLYIGGTMAVYFGRYYASGLKQSGIAGSLGDNWRHNFEWSMTVDGTDAAITSDKGRSITFSYNGASWDLTGSTSIPFQFVQSGSDYVLYNPGIALLYTFDSAGVLIKIEDGKGNTHTLTYSGSDLTTVSDGLGRTLTFTYSGGKLSTVSDGTRTVVFAYTGDDLTSYTDAASNVTTYTYDTGGLMTSKTLPQGNTPYSQVYGTSGKVTSQTDASENTTTFAYDSAAGTTTMTDPLGDTRVHTHTAGGELNNSTDRESNSVAIGSDADGRRNSITDRLGDTIDIVYHQASGKLASKTNADDTVTNFSYTARAAGSITQYDLTGITHADSTTESYVYDSNGNMTSHTDRAGNTSSSTYNGNGQILTATNKAGGVMINTYNADGTAETRTDPNGNTTTFGYDSLRRLNLTTYADGSTESFSYDDLDRLLTTTYNGNTTTMSYDDNGNLISATDPLNNTTTFTYDGNDRLLTTTDPNGVVVGKTFDALGRLETTTDENNNTTTRSYDTLGRLKVITDPNGNTNSFTYDAEGVIDTTTDGLGNTITFITDKMGRVTDVTTPMGHLSRIGYDQMGRVTSTSDPLGLTTTFNLDSMGLLSGIELPGGISASYARNVLSQITTVTDPIGNDWLQRYDVQGRLISRSDPLGNTITTDHDNRKRISHVTYPGGLGGLDIGYDLAGNLTDADYSDGTTLDYTYDKNNRLNAANGITRSYDVNGRISKNNGIDVARDPGGRITSMTLASGKNVTYEYHDNNNLISVTDWTGGVTTFDYDAAGKLVSIVRPNGVNTTKIRDDDGRLTGISEGVISSIALTLDAAGRTTAATRNVPLSGSAAGLAGSNNTYDAASQVSDFTYDALGRLIDDGARTYSWNLASRLTSVTEGAATSFTYDGVGNRLSKTTGEVTRSYVWNYALGLPSVSVEMLGAATLRYYIHTPGGRLLYSIEASDDSRRDHHYDEMGNTIFVTDDAGAVIASYAYSPYGKIVSSTGGLDNLFTWQGQYGVMDDGNGLYYMRARYYDSVTERFISRDPVESINPQGINPYQYASGNPLNFFDPVGLAPNEYDPEEFHGYERLAVLARDSALGALPFELYNIVRMKTPETAAEWALWALKKVAGPAGAVAELGANIVIIIIDEHQNAELYQGNLEAKTFMRLREIDAEREARRVLIDKDFDKLTTMGSQARSILREMALKKLIKLQHDLAAKKELLASGKLKYPDYLAEDIKRLEEKEWFLLNATAAQLIPGEDGNRGVWSAEPSSNREAANEPTLGGK